VTRLAAIAQRCTAAWRALVDVLADAGAPVTTAAIAELDTSLTTSSTYRNLTVLKEARIVRRLVTSAERASFELAEELTEHHHHMIGSSLRLGARRHPARCARARDRPRARLLGEAQQLRRA